MMKFAIATVLSLMFTAVVKADSVFITVCVVAKDNTAPFCKPGRLFEVHPGDSLFESEDKTAKCTAQTYENPRTGKTRPSVVCKVGSAELFSVESLALEIDGIRIGFEIEPRR